MADHSGEKGEKGFAKKISRQMARTKEKVMKKIKNEDRTTDGEFDRTVESFNQQQAVANQLLKEFKTYLTNVKAMAMASQNMYQTIRDSYERTWNNADEFVLASENLISSWDVYCAKLNDSVYPILADYVNKFGAVKAKVAKRGRKLTDFDSSRRNVDSLENAKKRDETKISKAHEEFNTAKLVYESIHSELSEELPILYQSRVSSLCSYFGALFQAEAQFDDECSKVKTSLEKLVEVEVESSVETPDRSLTTTPSSASTPPRPHRSISNSITDTSIEERLRATSEEADSSPDPNEYITLVCGSDEIDSESSDPEDQGTPDASCSAKSSSRRRGGTRGARPDRDLNQLPKSKLSSSSSDSDDLAPSDRQCSGDGCKVKSQRSVDAKKNGMKDGQKSSPKGEGGGGDEGSLNEDGKLSKDISGNNPIPLDKKSAILTAPVPENVDNYLFQVVAIHDYKAEGSNELSFEEGDIIHVLPLEEVFTGQDENWLFGVKPTTGEKGIFPLNFTNKM